MKIILSLFLLSFSSYFVNAQGCSDAGVCTIGNFYANHPGASRKALHKNEIDLSYTYGTHLSNERFYQPQLNYRYIKNEKTFFEIRVPLSSAKNTSSGISTTGIGDITTTYNSKINIKKKHIVDYALGLRISLSNADKKDDKSTLSYPMTLQTGLGTTDIIAAASYSLCKYLSVGTGLQVPVLQYNKNQQFYFYNPGFGGVRGDGYRRRPDALLKLTGHYQAGNFKMNAGLLGIFHLGNDYYNTVDYNNNFAGKFVLENSKGTTLNWNAELSYAITKNCMIGILYAEPLKTRTNIPDGLARSRIISTKVTFGF